MKRVNTSHPLQSGLVPNWQKSQHIQPPAIVLCGKSSGVSGTSDIDDCSSSHAASTDAGVVSYGGFVPDDLEDGGLMEMHDHKSEDDKNLTLASRSWYKVCHVWSLFDLAPSHSVLIVYHQDQGDSLSTIATDQTHFQQAQEERDIVRKPPPGYQESFQEESHPPCIGYYRCIEGVDDPVWRHDYWDLEHCLQCQLPYQRGWQWVLPLCRCKDSCEYFFLFILMGILASPRVLDQSCWCCVVLGGHMTWSCCSCLCNTKTDNLD